MQEVSEFQITAPLCFLFMWPLCLAQFTAYCIEPHDVEIQKGLNLSSGPRNVPLLRKHPWIWITVLETIFWCLAARSLNLHANKKKEYEALNSMLRFCPYEKTSRTGDVHQASLALDASLNRSGKETMFYFFQEQYSKHTLQLSPRLGIPQEWLQYFKFLSLQLKLWMTCNGSS